MTRKDFVLIADVLKSARPEPHWDANKRAQWEVTVNRFCERFALVNPLFNPARFRAACGVEA